MKIIYASDIHESYKNLQKLFRMTEADLYIIAGDLLYSAFPSWELAERFTEMQQRVYSWGLSRGIKGTRFTMARHMLETPETPLIEQALAKEFLRITDLAQASMLQKYGRMAKIFTASGKTDIITIPGNYDMDLKETALASWNLHLQTRIINGITFAGYGGSPVFTPGIPDNLRITYNELRQNGRLISEPYEFFTKTSPDVILLHQPAYGYLDTIATYGSIGSIGVRDFIDHSSVRLVLSGHMHEDWGAIFKQGKVFLNPSNFGRVVEIHRIKKGGYFTEFTMDGTTFTGGMLRQIDGGKAYDIEQCIMRDDKFRLLVIDLKRYRYLSNIKKRQKHIRAIRLFNALRGFFQKHETEATRTRIEALKEFCRKLHKEGHEIAFHLLGSLNFGMATDTSDLDTVLYFRDPAITVPDDVSYPVPDYVRSRLGELKDSGIDLSICDCLNLARIEEAIIAQDVDNTLLQRFIFYYGTCRCVNAEPIKEVENLLTNMQPFRFEVEGELAEVFRMMISSFRHSFSFKKYQMRLHEKGLTVPPYIEEKIWEYLEYRDEKQQK
ncbi:MAG: metallophosphoesterase [Deltaproteobacteria bacterium]|nr:metallophosphoesterase [Deltaproteobacteria bacterium]